MRLKERIFDWVFPGRRRRRKGETLPRDRFGRKAGGDARDEDEGYDSRYFIQRRR